MWRPDDWAERYQEAYIKVYSGKYGGSPERAMFEAGADAYREALLKNKLTKKNYTTYINPEMIWQVAGDLVFIPEEEE